MFNQSVQVVPWSTLSQPLGNPSRTVTLNDPFAGTVPSGGDGMKLSDIWPEVLKAADWTGIALMVVIGAMWMFGNRSAAMARLFDMAIGYELIRHAPTILSWLRHF